MIVSDAAFVCLVRSSHPRLRLVLSSLLLAASFVPLWACAPQYPTAVRIKLATVPIGDAVDRLGDPIRENGSLRFAWTVESHFDPARYLEWVAAGLAREGFTTQQRQGRSLALTKFDGGDSFRLNIEVFREGPTRVRVGLIVSPD